MTGEFDKQTGQHSLHIKAAFLLLDGTTRPA